MSYKTTPPPFITSRFQHLSPLFLLSRHPSSPSLKSIYLACRRRLMRAPFPKLLVIDAWNASVGCVAERSLTHFFVTHVGTRSTLSSVPTTKNTFNEKQKTCQRPVATTSGNTTAALLSTQRRLRTTTVEIKRVHVYDNMQKHFRSRQHTHFFFYSGRVSVSIVF